MSPQDVIWWGLALMVAGLAATILTACAAAIVALLRDREEVEEQQSIRELLDWPGDESE